MKNQESRLSQFVLGTAQLGMSYGIANQKGKPSREVALSIVEHAFKNGICEFDTAQAYGESESVLGDCFEKLNITDKVKVVSKIDPQLEKVSKGAIIDSVRTSLKRLKIKKLYGLLLHRGGQLNQWQEKYASLFRALKKENLVEFSGVSIYDEDEFEKALAISGIEIIQIPFNVFDQRAILNGWFERAGHKQKRIYIRSIYLQGLLLMRLNELPAHMSFAKPFLKNFSDFCEKSRLTNAEAAMKFISQNCNNAKVIMGVEHTEQLAGNLKLVLSSDDRNGLHFESLNVSDSRVIDPAKWN